MLPTSLKRTVLVGMKKLGLGDAAPVLPTWDTLDVPQNPLLASVALSSSWVVNAVKLAKEGREKFKAPPVAVSLSWLLLASGIFLFLSGYIYMYDYSSYTTFICDSETCTLNEYASAKGSSHPMYSLAAPEVTHSFPRSSFERSAPVRMKGGKIVNSTGMKRRQMRKLGYSYSVIFRVVDGDDREGQRAGGGGGGGGEEEEEEEEENGRGGKMPAAAGSDNNNEIAVSRINLGKRTTRERVSVLTQKMRSGAATVKVEEGKRYSPTSIICMAVGITLISMLAMLGEFSASSYRMRYHHD